MSLLQAVLEALDRGVPEVKLGGLTGSSKAYALSRLIREGRGLTYVYVTPRGRDAVRFQQDLAFFLGPYAENELYFFPPHDVLPFANLSPHNQITCDRLKTLHALTRATPPSFIATTAAAILSPLPPKQFFAEPIVLKAGGDCERDSFLKTLAAWGYQNVPLVIDRGNFAVRGALVDLYPPQEAFPIRIEWMGDSIESIRSFDPKTQRSLGQKRDSVEIIPAREVILTNETTRIFAEKARKIGEDKDLPRTAWANLVEKAKEGIPFPGIETYLPLFYPEPSSFWGWLPSRASASAVPREAAWLPTNSVLVTDNSETSHPLNVAIEEHLEEVRTMTQGKDHLLRPEEVIASASSIVERMQQHPRLSFTWANAPGVLKFETETHESIRSEIERAKKGIEPLAPLAKRIRNWLNTDSVFLVAGTRAQAERLQDLLTHYLPQPPQIHEGPFGEKEPTPSTLCLMAGELSGGFRLPEERITFLTDQEIFGQKVRRAVKESFAGGELSSFAELKNGDPVVHKDFGIGLYRALTHMEINGTTNDFVVIEYQDGDKLYLPIYRLNLIHRYTGAEGKTPRIDRLGGAGWQKIRQKSEKAIRELAGDLLHLYAARTAGHKTPFSPPNELFEAFEASFPYEETPDQDRAIAEVLSDMQKDKPMDRLVLGDVGYGKTEVALRAAFKAVLDGKQVAILVPTTLLAFQHFDRFVQRFKDYPVTVDMLSRFRSAAEHRRTLQNVAEGKVDIVIGTHRLLQPDVSFKNLGLLVIDEEHRFGVGQKEKVKRLRKDVDVLALSATPIPRSLYMSLVGIRTISVIETPPTDRLSIRTFVMPFEEEVIQEAIVRELKRGGQVFFVHNEIESIGRMRDYLQNIVPEAKIDIGHGQMEEEHLEKVMIRFFHQEFNLLLCTTIIESGIDIPTANTIIINNADHFGLAQIYQLRGRVGRGGHRAYAYLLVPEEKKLTVEATQRLSVLQRFSDLGSGYKMASYDLEIRGAGNLLGAAQSGHMTAIGYELYTENLEKAIHELKGEKVLDEIDPELHFRIPAYLTDDYIPDPPVRLEIYRRLSSLDQEDEIEPIEDELRDRFGRPPPEVENLLELSALKVHAKKLRIKQIRYDGRHFVYAFDPSSPLNPDLLTQRIASAPKRYRLTPDFRFIVTQSFEKEALALQAAKKFLRELTLHLG